MQKQRQYLLVGYPFAGKTTLAKELEKRLGFTCLSIDEMKFELGYEGISDDDVSDDAWDKIFNELDKRIAENLKAGKTIINEYAWLTKEWRDRARKLATDAGVETKVIFVDTPENVVRERWKKNREMKERFDVADTVFEEAIRLFEKPDKDENVIVFNQNSNLGSWIKENLVTLRHQSKTQNMSESISDQELPNDYIIPPEYYDRYRLVFSHFHIDQKIGRIGLNERQKNSKRRRHNQDYTSREDRFFTDKSNGISGGRYNLQKQVTITSQVIKSPNLLS